MYKAQKDNEYYGIITDISEIRGFFANNCLDFKENYFNGWEYDMRLGKEYYTTTEDVPKQLDESDPYAIIKPGEFGLLITEESLNIPKDIMAFISVKFTYKKQGLINISGFHVDPGYKGKIIFSVYNAGPNDIVMKYRDPVFMIFFQGFLPGEKEIKGREGFQNIPADMVSAIRGRSVSLAANAHRIERLEFYFKFYGGIALSIILALLGVLLAQLLSNG